MTDSQKSELRGAVQGFVSEVLRGKRVVKKPEEIVEGLSFTRELGIDSLDILQMTATLEKRFKLKIPEGELKSMDDLGGVVSAVERNWPA